MICKTRGLDLQNIDRARQKAQSNQEADVAELVDARDLKSIDGVENAAKDCKTPPVSATETHRTKPDLQNASEVDNYPEGAYPGAMSDFKRRAKIAMGAALWAAILIAFLILAKCADYGV